MEDCNGGLDEQRLFDAYVHLRMRDPLHLRCVKSKDTAEALAKKNW